MDGRLEPGVNGARQNMAKCRRRGDERVAEVVEIQTGYTGQSFGKAFEFARTRIQASDATRCKRTAILVRQAVRQVVSHVEFAVGPPSKIAEDRAGVVEVGCDLGTSVGFVVSVCVFKKQNARAFGDVDAAIAEQNGGRVVESVGEHDVFVRDAVSIDVIKNPDSIGAVFCFVLDVTGFVGIYDPQTTAGVPGHGDGSGHGLIRKEVYVKTIGDDKRMRWLRSEWFDLEQRSECQVNCGKVHDEILREGGVANCKGHVK